ncbi:hypothetical protein SLEP1_g19312 [Rubroshorea leprosula]|nr:hypothetical protein SLEP1_g19312 [Rubroshorea leprosula]
MKLELDLISSLSLSIPLFGLAYLQFYTCSLHKYQNDNCCFLVFG